MAGNKRARRLIKKRISAQTWPPPIFQSSLRSPTTQMLPYALPNQDSTKPKAVQVTHTSTVASLLGGGGADPVNLNLYDRIIAELHGTKRGWEGSIKGMQSRV